MTRTLAQLLILGYGTLGSAALLQRTNRSGHLSSRELQAAFSEYVARYTQKDYNQGSQEYQMRQAVFQRRLAEINRLNTRPHRSWEAVVNKFTDQTDEELASWRGYDASMRSQPATNARPHKANGTTNKHFPKCVSWMHLKSVQQVESQGGCGSCWAFNAAKILQAHFEIYSKYRTFSEQQMVSCIPNPQNCGGQGGCKGATASLGLEYALYNGVVEDSEFPYVAEDTPCPAEFKARATDSRFDYSRKGVADSDGSLVHMLGGSESQIAQGHTLGMQGWIDIATNRLDLLKSALVERGPIGVSVTSSHAWHSYGSGILSEDDCPAEPIVNHAVVLIGYGNDKSLNRRYWHILNSWGSDWGEQGYGRIAMSQDEDSRCGWDTDPQAGSGCDGGPSRVWVCGTCGILYHALTPQFAEASGGQGTALRAQSQATCE